MGSYVEAAMALFLAAHAPQGVLQAARAWLGAQEAQARPADPAAAAAVAAAAAADAGGAEGEGEGAALPLEALLAVMDAGALPQQLAARQEPLSLQGFLALERSRAEVGVGTGGRGGGGRGGCKVSGCVQNGGPGGGGSAGGSHVLWQPRV